MKNLQLHKGHVLSRTSNFLCTRAPDKGDDHKPTEGNLQEDQPGVSGVII